MKPEYEAVKNTQGLTLWTYALRNVVRRIDEKYVYQAIKTVNRGIEEDLWWGYFSDGTLVLDGEAVRMKDYNFDNSPWYEYRDEINRIVVLDGIKYIGNCSFCGMYNVKEIYISKDVNEISNLVFLKCKSLESINVDKENKAYSSVNGVFFDKNQTRLLTCPEAKKTIEIPASVTEIEEDFTYDHILEEINVSDDNKYFSSRNGVLYNKAGMQLIRCPIGKKGEYSIDNNTKKIEACAFQYCRGLEKVVLSNKLGEIGASAFSGCKKLKEMVIPESIKNVEGYAFMDCEDLEEVVFEGKLEEIGYLSIKLLRQRVLRIILRRNKYAGD